MLGLTLREEFKSPRLHGTAIELCNDRNTGATQLPARTFLEITYPTRDLLKGLHAIGPDRGRPIAVIGERGIGKSHLMAALYHAVNDAVSTRGWLKAWSSVLDDPQIANIPLREKMLVIGESLHRQRYKFLWDLLLERHPHGTYIKGKWEGMGATKTDVPSDKLILELLEHTPILLLLDEFQTWFDSLTDTEQCPWKSRAYNFIQTLSEIAKDHPDRLVLVICVRNGRSDAYQQLHRVGPVTLDFKAGGNAERIQQDRRRMLLHRLFANRRQILPAAVESLIGVHIREHFRLLAVPSSEQERRHGEFLESWPFAPQLLRLLEEQILIATDAQETRDMIRILASLYKARGADVPLLTAADFRIDDTSDIGELLESVSNEHHRALRNKARQNIRYVETAVPGHAHCTPHLQDIVGALWLRSIAVGHLAGADRMTLQSDITRGSAIDDNAFEVELDTIVANSYNIHREDTRCVFREEDNAEARVKACARNDKLFCDGSDLAQLAKEIRHAIGDDDDAFRVIALPKDWLTDPWTAIEASERPDRWDERLLILVVPEAPDDLDACLGRWLKDHLYERRNTVRFLLPRPGSTNAFLDRELLTFTRIILKAGEWSHQATDYKALHVRFRSELRDILKQRFDRFAVLHRWNFVSPEQCRFSLESLERADRPATSIPVRIEQILHNDLFDPEDFETCLLDAAALNESLGKVLRDLREPRHAGCDCIPWLGAALTKDRILRLCARGKLAINNRGLEYLQAHGGEDEMAALDRLRSKLAYTSGRQLDEVMLALPSAIPSTGGVTAPLTPTPSPGNPINPEPVPPPGVRESLLSRQAGPKPRIGFSNPPASPMSLIGRLERWGIGPTTPLAAVSIQIATVTGAQLESLFKQLPEHMRLELSLEKEAP